MDEQIREWIRHGNELYAKKDYLEVRKVFSKVVESGVAFADIYHMLGVAHHALNELEKARGAMEKALEINPRYTEAALGLVVVYNALGKYEEARWTYQNAIHNVEPEDGSLDPFAAGKLANMHADLGDAYRSMGMDERAAIQYRDALELRPRFVDIRTKLGATYRKMGRLDVATAELKRALEHRKGFVEARVQLGLCYDAQGMRDEAHQEWEKALELDPEHPAAGLYLRLADGDTPEQKD